MGVSFQKEGESTNRRQKFLKVGQKVRSSSDRQSKKGLHDSRRRAEERKGGI